MGFLDIIGQVILDFSQPKAELATNQAAINAQAADWRSKRNLILLEMHSINMGISLIVQSIRMVVRITGQTLDPIQNALLSMISSTVSLMVATSTAMATTGILAGAALILAATAFTMQLANTAKVISDFTQLKIDFAAIHARLSGLEAARVAMGVRF